MRTSIEGGDFGACLFQTSPFQVFQRTNARATKMVLGGVVGNPVRTTKVLNVHSVWEYSFGTPNFLLNAVNKR